jgi:hypothetical protein
MSTDPKQTTTMILPKGGMQAWTDIMQGPPPAAPVEMNNGAPIVMAYTQFDDGTQVAGGVYKWDVPEAPEGPQNVKFMWVFDANGTQYPGWPIDVSDDEDFFNTQYTFSLVEGGETYTLNIVEAQ